ncbi:MAG: sensor histidine kinase [Candidatus Rifleibacteriota bacterium]
MSNPDRITGKFYGSRLFLKFFLWFWAIATATAVLVGAYAYIFHIEPETRRFDQFQLENMQETAALMADIYEKEGLEAAAALSLKEVDWFFDENLENVLREIAAMPGAMVRSKLFSLFQLNRPHMKPPFDRTPPMKPGMKGEPDEKNYFSFVSINQGKIVEFASEVMKHGIATSWEIEGFHFQGCRVVSSSGKKYVAVRHLPWKSKKKHWFLVQRILEALPLLIIISAPFCFFLGRYMARPVIDISEASRRFASGDLQTRVTSSALLRFDEIGDLASDFNKMASQLESMIKSQQKLLGDISHELRSPLARMQVALEIMEKKSSSADKTMLDRVNLEVSRLNQLIGRLLELNRLGAAGSSENFGEIDLGLLLQRICDDGQFEACARNITIIRPELASFKLKANPQLLEQAIENILRNAIRYSPENSKIEVGLEKSADKTIVSVSDQGPGIAEEHLARIFEPFYRCQDDRDRKTGGVGLGLAIAQQSIKMHRGEIRLSNLESGGLKVEIILPC